MTDPVLEPPHSEIAAYNEFRAQLAELKTQNATIVFDYADPKGNKDARSHIYKLRLAKGAVDRARQAEKEESLKRGKLIDAEAKAIIGEFEAMIAVHETPLKELEQREEARIAKFVAELAEIEGSGLRASLEWMTLSLDAMRARLAAIEAEPITEERWQEFVVLAEQKKAKAIEQLQAAIAQREKHDAEQAELARLRQAEEARKQKERDDQIAAEAAQRERDKAAADLRAAEQKVEQEKAARIAAEEKAKTDAAAAEAKATRDREAAVEAERKAQADREAKERADAEAREANKRHRAKINNAALAAFVAGGVPEDAARRAVELIALKNVPNVTISY